MAEIDRGIEVVQEAVHTTTVRVGRIAGIVSGAVGQVMREIGDLVWDYRDIAGDARKSPPTD